MKYDIRKEILFNEKWWDAGLEANIAVQNDQPFINNCLEQLYKIKNNYLDNKNIYKDSEALFNYSAVAKEAKAKLNDILNKRFGINFVLLPDITGNACVFPVTPENFNVLSKGNENLKEEILAAIDSIKGMVDEDGRTKEVNDASAMKMSTASGVLKIYENLLLSVNAIEDTLKTSKVEFDLKNAKIKNLPEGMLTVLAIDFVDFFNVLTNEEILAVILHEVGHQYTHLLNTYRIARTNTVLKDTMKLAAEDKVDKVNLTLGKEFGITIPTASNLNSESNYKEITLFIEKLIGGATYTNTNEAKLSSRDSEALADQFATKFGLEKELFNALNVISLNYNEADLMLMEPLVHGFIIATIILMLITILLFVFITSTGILAGGFMLKLLAQLALTTIELKSITTIITFSHLAFRFMMGDMDSWEMVYDDKKRRLERIRNDAVRNLRGIVTTGVDKALIKSKLDDIEDMEKVIASIRKGRSLIAILGEMIFPWNRRQSTETLYQQTLENLEANKLTLLSEKFK